MSELLAALTYQDQPVRVLGTPDAPLFVAADLCRILGLENHRQVTSDFSEDEKGVHTVDTPGGPQNMLVVTEPGLYRLIIQSRKPVGAAFRRWVFHEVLPALRKTGRYEKPKDFDLRNYMRNFGAANPFGPTPAVEQAQPSGLRSVLERAEPVLLREPADQAHVRLVQRAWATLLAAELPSLHETLVHAAARARRTMHQERRAPQPNDLLTMTEVCRRLGISRWTLWRWIDAWREKVAAGEHVELGAQGYWPPATHGRGNGKRWERELVDLWIEAQRKLALQPEVIQ